MSEEELEKKGNSCTNLLKDPGEWLDIVRWMVIYSISVIIPVAGLVLFWVGFKPPLEVFLTVSGLYLTITFFLLKLFILK